MGYPESEVEAMRPNIRIKVPIHIIMAAFVMWVILICATCGTIITVLRPTLHIGVIWWPAILVSLAFIIIGNLFIGMYGEGEPDEIVINRNA